MPSLPSAVALTRDLVRAVTVNPPGDEHRCALLAGRLLEDAGFAIAYHAHADGRMNLVARLDGTSGETPICFTGHLDTVPLGSAPWSFEPFGADFAGDRLCGRGASDMKSGVAAILVMALALAQYRPRRGLVVVLTAGEETGCEGARHLVGIAGALPMAGALVVGEPTGNAPLIGHKGALWLRAVFHGVTAHGSMPEQGDNALYKAARGILNLSEHRFHTGSHAHLGGPSLNVGTAKAGLNVNSVPDRAEIEIDIRTIPGQANEAIAADIRGLLGAGVELAPIVDVGAVATSPQNDWVSGVFDLCERRSGSRIDPRGASFFTDASVLTPAFGHVPTMILGPGEAAMAHKTDEYCLASKIEDAVGLYTEIARGWMGV